MTNRLNVFISSKQSEFEIERAVIADKVRSLGFFEPVLAEEWPPQRADVRQVYLDQVRQAPIYIGLFHRIYSAPTEHEYEAAAGNPHREMLIYLKESPPSEIDPQLLKLIERIKQQHVPRSFRHVGELLPRFTEDLAAALTRMVMMLQKLGEQPPSGRGGSVLRARWEREREAILEIGLPGDRETATALARLIGDKSRLL